VVVKGVGVMTNGVGEWWSRELERGGVNRQKRGVVQEIEELLVKER
jgi:hypothetical protein